MAENKIIADLQNGKIWFIYRMRSFIDGVGDYVGITQNPKRREGEHRRKSYGAKLRAAIQIHGQETFIFEIIDKCNSNREALRLEKEYIKSLGTAWPNGLNVSGAGKGIYSTESYEQNHQNRRIAQIALWADEDRRARHSRRLKLSMNEQSAREKNSNAAKERWKDPEYLRRQSEGHIGKKHSPESIEKIRASAIIRYERERSQKPEKLAITAEERARRKKEGNEKARKSRRESFLSGITKISETAAILNLDPDIKLRRIAGIKKAFQERPRGKASEETRKKMSEAHKRRWESKRRKKDDCRA